jgi:hypothetical protein
MRRRCLTTARGGKTPLASHRRLRELGLKLVILSLTLLFSGAPARRFPFARIKANGGPIDRCPSRLRVEAFLAAIGVGEVCQPEQRFADT